MDAGVTFFLTAGLYCWARAYFCGENSWWYVLGFVSIALGCMFKAFHAILLPCLVILVFFGLQRDWSALRQKSLYTGLGIFLLLVVPYYWVLSPEFRETFFFKESIDRVIGMPTVGNQPVFYYLGVLWFDFSLGQF